MTDDLAQFSAYLDATIRARFATMSRSELEDELLLVHRTIKVVEEIGEAVQKLIGVTGANPRKGVEATLGDLLVEFHDVAVSVLGAGEHVRGNAGGSMDLLAGRIHDVTVRAGLKPAQPLAESGQDSGGSAAPDESMGHDVAPRRLRACVEAWPGAHTGGYDPRCCRFPKSCSASVYSPEHVGPEDLEGER